MNWIKTHPTLEIGEQGIRQLRETAKGLGIRNYSRMTKLKLMRVIDGEKQSGNVGRDEIPGSQDASSYGVGKSGGDTIRYPRAI